MGGESVVERLSADLADAFPEIKGFSANNLWLMRQFYTTNASAEFLELVVQEFGMDGSGFWQQPVAKFGRQPRSTRHEKLEQAVQELNNRSHDQLEREQAITLARELVSHIPWGHHLVLNKKVKNPAERLFYLHATAQNGWSRAILLNQIKSAAYERSVTENKTHNFTEALPEALAEQAAEMMKSRYNLEFLGIHRAIKERDLENLLIDNLQHFLLELGYGFCFIGRQYRLVLGMKEYFVDLLFYHRFLKVLVAFDLKIGDFEPEHAGKMDFYLNLLNDQ